MLQKDIQDEENSTKADGGSPGLPPSAVPEEIIGNCGFDGLYTHIQIYYIYT